MDADRDLLLPTYSPRRVAFWLSHWAALEALAESEGASDGEGDRLVREWELLRDRPGVCLCASVEWPPIPPAYGSGGHFGPAEHSASIIRADLERATDTLPLDWFVTRAIHQAQGLERLGRWQWRYCMAHGLAGYPLRDPILDARPTLYEATVRMAQSLGWIQPMRGGGVLVALGAI